MKKTYKNNSKWKKYTAILLLTQFVMFFSLIVFGYVYNFYTLNSRSTVKIAIDVFIIIMLVLVFWSIMQTEMPDKRFTVFLIMVFADSFYTYLDAVLCIIDKRPEMRIANIVLNTVYYSCSIILAFLFWNFICAEFDTENVRHMKLSATVNIITAVALLFVLGNLFGKYYFSVSNDGVFMRSSTYYLSVLFPTLVFTVCDFYILGQKTPLFDKLTVLSYSMLPYLCVFVSSVFGVPDFMGISATCSIIYIYASLFVIKERERARLSMNSLLLQMNPHFIYNTLGTVSSLCSVDPESAEKTLLTFSQYLRENFGELANKTMIPFETEIKHLELYISMQKLRFPDIVFETDFKAGGFEIPSLSVQPLVENAITHGIMGRETGGKLSVSSYADDKFYYVKVEDDGIGFENIPQNDGRNHIGIANVSARLQMLCDGDLMIESTLGVGTVATIRLRR